MTPIRKRILIIEDEWLIGEYLADHLIDAGYEVAGPLPSVAQALSFLAENAVDAALLDIRLGDEKSFPIAKVLFAADVPFVFLSGYVETDLPNDLRDAPLLSKPIQLAKLDEMLGTLWN
ncbi:response regulator [Rhizobium leguminosarum]|jgi:DNA-binding response OmpR family regulator|uniref:response regulator n=1 Tax=Rhizobium leguminosarum TaxID=384 RepID=UPI003F9939F8